ncbi:MAG: peptidyl-prolyl cis-trans isomerase [Bacteroidia bacterium]|nr:peptidyl-prolyl cis-trans isomerase [Bacteroidia bacterium]
MLQSCKYLRKEQEGVPIARVHDSYLYLEDIESLFSEGIIKEDSILRVNNYINQWATQKLLQSGAELNLPLDKQLAFNDLVNQYKTELFIKAYLEGLVKQKIDTVVNQTEALEVYQRNKETFKLNEELIKFRYINVSQNIEGLDEIKERFKNFDYEDKYILDSISLQFKAYSLNDSIWIRAEQMFNNIPVLKQKPKEELLKKSNFIELQDSLGLYLMQINDVLHRNETAPIEYVMPTIKQIVINKRKLDFIKQLEKDITKDAIKNKEFEIYN